MERRYGWLPLQGMRISSFAHGILSLLVLTILTACVPATKIPVDTVSYPYKAGARQECLIVFLPGRGAAVTDYDKEGFIDTARQAGIRADMVSTDLHLGYYIDGTAFMRLREDVIQPARSRGYVCIWLVGISLGAYGALAYEVKSPGEITGLVLFAPYLGDKEIIDEISSAGSVKTWKPGSIAESDYQRKLWAWIKEYASKPHDSPVIYLGYGKKDRFAREDGLLAETLDSNRIITGPGIHAWTTWKPLWQSLLNTEVGSGFLGVPKFQNP